MYITYPYRVDWFIGEHVQDCFKTLAEAEHFAKTEALPHTKDNESVEKQQVHICKVTLVKTLHPEDDKM